MAAELIFAPEYAIFYEYGAGTVTVYAILHCSRDPETRRNRLP